MNTLTQNTVFDTPSFAVNTQLESTGIRELTLEEIELVNGACWSGPESGAAALAGATVGFKYGKFGGVWGAAASTVGGAAAGYLIYGLGCMGI